MEKSVIYMDKEGIKITESSLYIEDKQIPLRDLRDIRLKRKNISRWPGVILFGLGITGLLVGSLKFIGTLDGEWRMVMEPVGAESLYIGLGVVAILIGILSMILLKDRYVVSIQVDQQEKELTTTTDRSYAIHLSGVLKKAYYRFVPIK